MSDPQLLPCPFCGREAKFYYTPNDDDEGESDGRDFWGVRCEYCPGMVDDDHDGPEEAAKAWNKRASDSCQHYFHFHKGHTVARCEKCQSVFPISIEASR